MALTSVDIFIIVGYLVFITSVGLWVSKKASGSAEAYFLGGRSLPWFLLGISGMATFIDIGGTAYQGAWYYLFGSKGFWFTVEGAVAILIAFQMVYVGKWLNRSGVMTNAQWMIFRFGTGRQGETARLFSAFSALALCAASMAFFFVGSGKGLVEFLPFFDNLEETFPFLQGVSPANVAGLLFFILVGMYTVASGFYGVVYTDFIQAFLILALILTITGIAFSVGTPEYFASHAPAGWFELFPSDGNWSLAIPGQFDTPELADLAKKSSELGVLLIVWFISIALQGLAAPFDPWTAQRYYAAKNERESSLLAAQWIFLWSFRFLLMASIGVLALGVASKIHDPEKALSVVIIEYVRPGVRGLLLAALLAAAMSTIDSTANSAGAYFVKDIYQRFLRPRARGKELVRAGYLTTFGLIAFAVVVGWQVRNINAIWGWICIALFVGTLPPNIVKWFWWRANGASFAFGTAGGVVAAVITLLPAVKAWDSYWHSITAFGIATFMTFLGALLFPPANMDELVAFYKKTKPFGFWGPVRARCDEETVNAVLKENRRDIALLLPAIAWQLSLFLFMSSLVFKDWCVVVCCAVVFGVTSLILYKYWYKNLSRGEPAPIQPSEFPGGPS